MEVDDLCKRIRHLTSPWVVLTQTEVREVQQLSETCCSYMMQQCEQLIRDAGERPVLVTHMCDGLGTTTHKTECRLHNGVKATTHTRFRDEFLLQRQVVRTNQAGQDRVAIAIMPPCPLEDGKTSWNVAVATQAQLCAPRGLGHKGICIVAYLQDGALAASTRVSGRLSTPPDRMPP